MLQIAYSGENIHLVKQSTTTMATIIMSNEMTSRIPYGIAMESSHISTLQIPGIMKQARQIHIFSIIKTATVISLGILCDYGCTITLYKQYTSVHINVQEIIKGTGNKQTIIWEVLLETQQSEAVKNSILDQTTKPELS